MSSLFYFKKDETVWCFFLSFQFQVQMAQGWHHLGLDEEERLA